MNVTAGTDQHPEKENRGNRTGRTLTDRITGCGIGTWSGLTTGTTRISGRVDHVRTQGGDSSQSERLPESPEILAPFRAQPSRLVADAALPRQSPF